MRDPAVRGILCNVLLLTSGGPNAPTLYNMAYSRSMTRQMQLIAKAVAYTKEQQYRILLICI